VLLPEADHEAIREHITAGHHSEEPGHGLTVAVLVSGGRSFRCLLEGSVGNVRWGP
jgi:hypothetical protein